MTEIRKLCNFSAFLCSVSCLFCTFLLDIYKNNSLSNGHLLKIRFWDGIIIFGG